MIELYGMGSPNVVRGRSHIGWASAARLAEAGICNVLSSDYYYPSMLRAALILAGRGVVRNWLASFSSSCAVRSLPWLSTACSSIDCKESSSLSPFVPVAVVANAPREP